MAIVTIVGAGLMGTATAWPLRDNGHEVRLVGTHLDAEIIKSCRQSGFHPRLQRALPEGVRSFFIEEIGEALKSAESSLAGSIPTACGGSGGPWSLTSALNIRSSPSPRGSRRRTKAAR